MKHFKHLSIALICLVASFFAHISITRAQFFLDEEPPTLDLQPNPPGTETQTTPPTAEQIANDPYCRIYCPTHLEDQSCAPCFAGRAGVTGDAGVINVGNPLGTTYDKDTTIGLQRRLGSLLSTMLRGIAALSLLPIVVGGFQMIISQGNEDKVSRGKNTLYFGVVGLVLALTGIAIFQTLLSFLVNAPKQ